MIKIDKLVGLFLLLAIVFGLTGCDASFLPGFNKDLLSGLQVTNNGLDYDKAYITLNGNKVQTNSFDLGDEVVMIFEGVENYIEEGRMVFPGASLLVTDLTGNEVLSQDNLLSNYAETGIDKIDSGVVTINFNVGPPMITGEKYLWQVRVWDQKGEGEINAELSVVVL